MIVVAVVAILGAIAMPSYSEYVRRGHRADARAGLLQAQHWLERVATATGVYPTTDQGVTTLPAELTWSGDSSKRYTIGFLLSDGITNSNAAYTLLATRRGSQAVDRCGDFTLTHTGMRDALNRQAGTSAMECWAR
jgi:type IV pilus assembly protein PilE